MKYPSYRFRGALRGWQAFTLIEVLFVVVISVLVTSAVISTLVATARAQREGMYMQRVYETADRVQDRSTRLLQGGSKEAGIFLHDLANGYYREIIFRNGTGPGFPNQSLRFDPQAGRLVYDPDITVDDNEQFIAQSQGDVVLESVDFQTGQKTGGIPDSGVILIRVIVSDRGRARQAFRDSSSLANQITSSRTFAVNLRRY